MCGRFQLTPPDDWMAEFGLDEPPDVMARYNIAPTQPLLAVRQDGAGFRRAAVLRWGLVPSWATDPAVGNRLINARAESVSRKPAFRDSFQQRRCLVPATGFYEWKRVGGVKEPYLVRMRDDRAFAFAGVWDRWQGEEGRIESCAILTTWPNALVAAIHNRMPVVLPRSAYDLWLDPDVREDVLHPLLRPFPADEMEAFPVSTRMNRADVDDPECARPIPAGHPVPVQRTLF